MRGIMGEVHPAPAAGRRPSRDSDAVRERLSPALRQAGADTHRLRRHGCGHLDRRAGAGGGPAGRHRPHFRRHGADRLGPPLPHPVRQGEGEALQVQRRQHRQVGRAVRSRAARRSDAHARRPDHAGQARRRHDLRQLHGKAHDERAAGDAAGAPDRRPRRGDRRHHALRGPAPRLVRADGGPPALSRCEARHHRLVAAGAAAVPAQEREARPAARLRHRRGAARRRAPGLRRGRLGQARPARHRRRNRALSAGRGPCDPADPRGRDLHRERRGFLSRERRRRGAGGDAVHGDEGMRAAGQGASRSTSRLPRRRSW